MCVYVRTYLCIRLSDKYSIHWDMENKKNKFIFYFTFFWKILQNKLFRLIVSCWVSKQPLKWKPNVLASVDR